MARPRGEVIRLGSVSERVYGELCRQMDSHALAVNARLPTEQQLCEQFAASRTAVRRALKRLSSEGRIESRQGSGSYVRERAPERTRSNTIAVMYLGSTERLTRLQDSALRQGYVIALYSQVRAGWDTRQEALFLEQVWLQHHRGLIAFCSPTEPRNDELLDDLDRAGVAVVHVEHYTPEVPKQSYVLPDYRRAAHTAAVSLMLAGYDRLVMATMSSSGPFCRLHEAGFLEALQEHRSGDGRLVDVTRSAQRGNHFDIPKPDAPGFESRLDAFVDSLPTNTGIVCSAPGWARWLRAACERRGRVPGEDVGLIAIQTAGDVGRGVEDIDAVSFGEKSLYDLALEEICRPEFTGVKTLLPPTIVRCGTVRGG